MLKIIFLHLNTSKNLRNEATQKGDVMGLLKIEGVNHWSPHWSIGVNNLGESEAFYGGFLGLEARGRLGNSGISCFSVGDNNILLCHREHPMGGQSREEKKYTTPSP